MKKRKLLNKEIIIKTRKLQNVRIINNFNPFLNLTSKYLIAIIYKFFCFFSLSVIKYILISKNSNF